MKETEKPKPNCSTDRTLSSGNLFVEKYSLLWQRIGLIILLISTVKLERKPGTFTAKLLVYNLR